MNKDNKLLVKNSLLLSIAPFLPKIINVLLLPIMTKYLTDVDFGIFGTISAYTQAVGAFATLGLTIFLVISFYKNPIEYKDIWSQIYGFLKLWMIVYAGFQVIILYFFIPVEAIENKWWIIILSQFSTVFFGPAGTIGNSYYIYNKESFPIVWRSVVASILTIIVNFVLIVYLRKGYMGWYVGSFVGTFFTNASYWYVVNRKLGIKPNYRFKWAIIKHALSIGVPTIPHYYTNYLLEGSGRMILHQYRVSQGEIGQVSLVQQIGDIFQTGISGLNNALSPFIMQAIKDKNEQKIRKLGLAFCSLIFILAFGLSIWSKEIFSILISNPSLNSAYPYFILYIMALCYRPLYLIVSSYFFYYERTKQLLLITFLSGCIAFLLYIVMIPYWGIWAFLVGHYIACLYYGYSGFFYRSYKSNSKLRFPTISFFFIQLLLTGLSFFLVERLILKSIISIGLILVGIFLFIKYRNVVKN